MAHKVAVLLKVRSSLGEKEAKDDKRHVAKRYLPWFSAADFAKDPGGTIKKLFSDFAEALKAGAISGTSTDGEVVEEQPFKVAGTGKGDPALSYDLLTKMLERGFTLANQQQMHEVLVERYGKDKVAKAAATGGAPEESI